MSRSVPKGQVHHGDLEGAKENQRWKDSRQTCSLISLFFQPPALTTLTSYLDMCYAGHSLSNGETSVPTALLMTVSNHVTYRSNPVVLPQMCTLLTPLTPRNSRKISPPPPPYMLCHNSIVSSSAPVNAPTTRSSVQKGPQSSLALRYHFRISRTPGHVFSLICG